MNDRTIVFDDLGLTVFEHVVSLDLLKWINASIDATRHRWRPADGRRETATAKSFGDLLRQSDAFRAAEVEARAASRRWAMETFGRPLAENVLHVIRCVNRDVPSQSHLRHFDSHSLTLLIPLQLAGKGDRNGDLLLYKKRRQSISLARNVLTKGSLIMQHNLPFAVRRALTRRDLHRRRCVRVACEPGNVYVFNGFITLHANLDVAAGERRSLIIHYYDPGMNAGLRSTLRVWRALRDRIADAL
jgi:hypothetical protein